MIRYKNGVDVLAMLKEKGFTSYTMRRDNIIGQSRIQRLRKGELPSWSELSFICLVLGCQPGDLIECVPDKIEGNESNGCY